MNSQKLLPLLEWSSEVFRIGKQEGLSTTQITESITAISKERGWEDSQINKILRHNGVLKPIRRHVINIICPKCGLAGRLNSFSSADKPEDGRIHYYVLHGPMKGKWGKTKPGKRRNTWGKTRIRKHRRCYFYYLSEQPEYFRNIVAQLFPISND